MTSRWTTSPNSFPQEFKTADNIPEQLKQVGSAFVN
jgi:hypothetical protein